MLKKVFTLVTCISSLHAFSQDVSDFRIGMIGLELMRDSAKCQERVPYPLPTFTDANGIERNSSSLNVLKEDGFNTVLSYSYPGYWRKNVHMKAALDLLKAHDMQLHASLTSYYKASVDNCHMNGEAVFDGGDTNTNECTDYRRPNYDLMMEQIFNQAEYANTIWGYHVAEEPELYNPINPDEKYEDPDNAEEREEELSVVQEAFAHFRTKKLPQHKLVQMHASHGKSITGNVLYDAEGPTTSNEYMELPERCDVFFEGSYLKFYNKQNDWHVDPYDNIFNIGINYEKQSPNHICNYPITWRHNVSEDNNRHYLGFLESLNYGKSLFGEVQKVLFAKTKDPEGLKSYDSQSHVANGNWLWFTAYASIIHGANGIWFYSLTDMYQSHEASNKAAFTEGTYKVAAYERASFPNSYNKYIAPLVRELSYLNEQGFLKAIPSIVLDDKLAEDDPHCVVKNPDQYLFQTTNNSWSLGSQFLDSEHQSKNYGLRYSIRTNGDETVMIIANVLPYVLKTDLDFSGLNNHHIQHADKAELLFTDHQPELHFNGLNDGYNPYNYKSTRDAVDINGNLTYTSHEYNFNSKTIDLTFGPFDVHIIKFTSTEAIPSNDDIWEMVWNNGGMGKMSNVEISSDHQVIAGNFASINGHADEILTIQKYNSNAWASMLYYDNASSDWANHWSNNGLGNMKSTPGGVGIKANTRFIAGNFRGDSFDELLTINWANSGNHWSTMIAYNPNSSGNWDWLWSTNGKNYLDNSQSLWQLSESDKILVADFDNDGYDELLLVQSTSTPKASILEFDLNANDWKQVWTNVGVGNGIGYMSGVTLSADDQFFVGNFQSSNSNNYPEILIFKNGTPSTWTQVLHFDPTQSGTGSDPSMHWGQSNNGSNFFIGKSLPLNDSKVLTGNLDTDSPDELMFVRRHNATGQSILMDMNSSDQFAQTWNNASVPYLESWYTKLDPSYQLDYLVLDADPQSPGDEILALRTKPKGNCQLVGDVALLRREISQAPQPQLTEESKQPIDNSLTFEVYPNPTKGQLNIRIKTPGDIANLKVVDLNGRILRDQMHNVDSYLETTINDLKPGIYFIQLSTENQFLTRKVIVTH